MFKIRITEMLGIEYHHIQGGILVEQRGATLEELLTVISGQAVGLIDDLKGVQEVIEEIADDARTIYQRSGTMGIGAKER